MTPSLWLVVRVAHLLAAAIWTGGLVTLGVLVVALRRAGATREQLRAAARAFANLSWSGLGVAVATGVVQATTLRLWGHGALHVKLALVSTMVLLAGVHQLTARRTSARARGVIQLGILALALGTFVAAARLAAGA
ncbi:MAG TPA: hypothetical protein VNN80_01805 [Polyangiaceae bacterium]|nr:hypothetical protein [Polyangiaceae bacterium]